MMQSVDIKKELSLAVNTGSTLPSPSQPSVVSSRHVQLSPALQMSLPILSYCAASILMTVMNKYVVSGEFNMVFLLLTVQSIVTVVFMHIFRFLNLIKFREYNAGEAKKWMPIVVFLVVMIYTGSKALQFLPIPVYTIFKNLTIILIAYGEVLWFGGDITALMMVSFGLMTLSSIIAGWTDVTDAITNVYGTNMTVITGYGWMAVNCFSSAAFVLYMRKRIKLTNFKDFDTVYYNNLLSIPLLIVPSLLLEDWSVENLSYNFPPLERNVRLWAMILSGASAFAMSYASAWCVRITSSTTYSMVGALNKLPIAVSGIVFFGDPATLGNVSAISIGFIAGLVYSYAKTLPDDKSKVFSASTQSVNDASKSSEKPR